jgi:hypothetical protein
MEETGISSLTKTLTNTFSSNPPSSSAIEPISDFAADAATTSGSESGYSIWSIISGILIVLIIWVLIFNLFNLGKVTDWIESILKFFGYSTGETIKTTANVGAAGLTGSTNVAAGALAGGVNMLEKGLNLTPEEKSKSQSQSQGQGQGQGQQQQQLGESTESAVLAKGLANLKKMTPFPDDATSVTQSGGRSKSGYCYIGEDRGFRSCINVGENDECMSGDIFPTMDICINPNLRT